LAPSFPNFDLEVKRVADGRIVIIVPNLAQNTAYGFSPNDHAFAYFSIRNQGGAPDAAIEVAAVYNLADANAAPVQPVWSFEKQGAASAGFGFSPHDRYFAFTVVSGPNSSVLKVIDTSDGRAQVDTDLHFFTVPIDNVQVGGWGFSPDPEDRSFVYAYTFGQLSASLNVINLESKQGVVSRTLHGEASWQFSPCGDVFGVVATNNFSGNDVGLI